VPVLGDHDLAAQFSAEQRSNPFLETSCLTTPHQNIRLRFKHWYPEHPFQTFRENEMKMQRLEHETLARGRHEAYVVCQSLSQSSEGLTHQDQNCVEVTLRLSSQEAQRHRYRPCRSHIQLALAGSAFQAHKTRG
jgi:hypothetical protein